MNDASLGQQLDLLWQRVESRKGADPTVSYTAKLIAEGPAKVAKKVGEEAVEVVIEATRGDRPKLVEETADLLYHILVMLAASAVDPRDVAIALEARESQSGLEEKAKRPKK